MQVYSIHKQLKNDNLKTLEIMKNRLITAVDSKYVADMNDALARLEIYIKTPVAIGEHPQHTEEIDKLVEQYTNAKDKQSALKEMHAELFGSQLNLQQYE